MMNEMVTTVKQFVNHWPYVLFGAIVGFESHMGWESGTERAEEYFAAHLSSFWQDESVSMLSMMIDPAGPIFPTFVLLVFYYPIDKTLI